MVEYGLEGDNVIVVRPSGTEPKIKVYFMVKGQSRAEAEDLEAQLKVQMSPADGILYSMFDKISRRPWKPFF